MYLTSIRYFKRVILIFNKQTNIQLEIVMMVVDKAVNYVKSKKQYNNFMSW